MSLFQVGTDALSFQTKCNNGKILSYENLNDTKGRNHKVENKSKDWSIQISNLQVIKWCIF